MHPTGSGSALGGPAHAADLAAPARSHPRGCARGAGRLRRRPGPPQSAPGTVCHCRTSPARCRRSCICASGSPCSRCRWAARISPAHVRVSLLPPEKQGHSSLLQKPAPRRRRRQSCGRTSATLPLATAQAPSGAGCPPSGAFCVSVAAERGRHTVGSKRQAACCKSEASTIMKSLPKPWYFANSTVRLACAVTLMRREPAKATGRKGACDLCGTAARADSGQARPDKHRSMVCTDL